MSRHKLNLAVVLVGLACSARAELRFTNVLTSASSSLRAVAYDGTNSFVAVGTNATANALLGKFGGVTALSDPNSWTTSTISLFDNGLVGTSRKSLLSVAFGDVAGKFLAGDLNGAAYTSTNGLNWSTQVTNVFGNGNSVRGLAYSQTSRVFVAVSGAFNISWSSNTVNWTAAPTAGGSGAASFNGVTAFGAAGFAACALNDYIVVSTDAGRNWVVRRPLLSLSTPDLNGIASDGGQTLFSVGTQGRILYSANGGTNWTLVRSNTVDTLNAVAYLNPGFIAVGSNGLILTITNVASSGGSNWVQSVHSPASNGLATNFTANLRSITIGTVGSLNKVVAITGDGGTVVLGGTSPTATVSGVNTNCNNTGTYTVPVAFGGSVGPWDAVWSDGAISNNVTSGTLNRVEIPTNSLANCPTNYTYFIVSLRDRVTGLSAKPSDLTGTNFSKVNPRPKATVSGTNTICNGQSFSFDVRLTGQAPWTVQLSDGSQLIVTSANITNAACDGWAAVTNVTRYPTNLQDNCVAVSNYFVVSVTDAAGCSGNQPGDLTGSGQVTVNPRPQVLISGTGTVCNGSPFTFAVNLKGQAPWTVQLSDGSQLIVPAGNITNASCVGWAAVTNVTRVPTNTLDNCSVTNSYSVLSVTDGSGCSGNAGDIAGTAQVKDDPRPQAAAVGTNTVCNGNSTMFQVLLKGKAPWTVGLSDGTFLVVGNAFVTNNSCTGWAAVTNVTRYPTNLVDNCPVTTNYTVVSVTDGTGCSGNAGDRIGSAQTTVNPRPKAAAVGTNSVCNGFAYTFPVLLKGQAPWTVGLSDGSTLVVGNASVTNNGCTGWSAVTNVTRFPTNLLDNCSATTSYSVVSVTDGSGCLANTNAGDITGTSLATVNPLPKAWVVGTNTLCHGSSFTFQVLLKGQAPWTVNLSDGSAVFVTSGSVTNNSCTNWSAVVDVTKNPTNALDNCPVTNRYTVTSVTSGSGCVANTNDLTGAAQATVNPRPQATVVGTPSVCNGSSFTLQVLLKGQAPWTVGLSDGSSLVVSNNFVTNNSCIGWAAVTNITRSVTNFLDNCPITTNYTVTSVTDASGCSGNAGDRVGTGQATINPLPQSSVLGTNTVCNGQSATFQILLKGQAPWTVNWSDGSSLVVSNTFVTNNGCLGWAAVANVTRFPTNLLDNCPVTTNYSVVNVTDASGCSATVGGKSGLAEVTVNPRPRAAAVGTNAICNGSAFTFQVLLKGQGPWTVGLSDGSTLSVSTNFVTNSLCTGWSAVTNVTRPQGSYTVTNVTDVSGCSGSQVGDLTGTAVASVNPVPTATLLIATNDFTVTAVRNAVNGSNTRTDSLLVSVNSSPATNINVHTKFSLPLVNSNSKNNKYLAVNYTNRVMYVTNRATLPGNGPWRVTWSEKEYFANGSLVASNYFTNNYSTAIITNVWPVTIASTNPGARFVFALADVTYTNGSCSAAATDLTNTFNVTVNGKPTAEIFGDTNICTGSSATIYAILSGLGPWTNIVWSDGVVTNSVSSIISRQVGPFVNNSLVAFVTNYSITSLTDSSGTNTTDTVNDLIGQATITVDPKPVNPPNSLGDVTTCTNVSAPLSVSVPAGFTADWYTNSVSPLFLVASGTTNFVPPQMATLGTNVYLAVARFDDPELENPCSSLATNVALITVDCPNGPTITSIAKSGNNVVINWVGNYVLLHTTNLVPTYWMQITQGSFGSNSVPVSILPAPASDFFRLWAPTNWPYTNWP